MVIDLRNYKLKGQFSGDFNFVYHPQTQLLPTPDSQISADGVTVEGGFDIDGRNVFVFGKITFTITGSCSRCLENATKVAVLEFDEKFSIFKNEDCYSYSKDQVDLTEMVENLILSNAPLTLYCKSDCKGLCPKCGANLNNGDCGCN